MFEKAKIKLIPHKNSNDSASPDYTIKYKAGAKTDGPASYEILSALAADGDLILELNTDLFFGETKNKKEIIENFINRLGTFNLEYVSRKTPSIHRTTIFGFSRDSNKKTEARELLSYIPNAVWKSEEFRKIVPDYGARYYMVKASADEKENLPAIWDMTDEEKEKHFRIILFDLVQMEQIGIFSCSVSIEELKSLLGL